MIVLARLYCPVGVGRSWSRENWTCHAWRDRSCEFDFRVK